MTCKVLVWIQLLAHIIKWKACMTEEDTPQGNRTNTITPCHFWLYCYYHLERIQITNENVLICAQVGFNSEE